MMASVWPIPRYFTWTFDFYIVGLDKISIYLKFTQRIVFWKCVNRMESTNTEAAFFRDLKQTEEDH